MFRELLGIMGKLYIPNQNILLDNNVNLKLKYIRENEI